MRDGAAGTGPAAPATSRDVLREPAFALFWGAATLRSFGGAISGVAVQVLIVSVLHATTPEISVLSAAGVLPYLLLGLVVGALMDRWRRQRTLILASAGRAIVLAAIPVLLLLHALGFWALVLILLIDGVLTLLVQSAEQPLLPRLVPQQRLVDANARLGQSSTIAQTAGPGSGGVLLTLLGAPLVFVVDALLNAVAAVLQSAIRIEEPGSAPRRPGDHLGHDVVEGLRYTYGHRTLRPLAISVHTWFLGNSIVSTLFAVFTLRVLGLPAWAFGVALAFGGVGGLVGAVLAPRLGLRLGAGRAILLGRTLAVLPWLLLAILPLHAGSGVAVLLPAAAAAQLVFGLAMGVEDANDTGYRQAVAPDALQARMNATIRTINRVVFFFGALLTAALVDRFGYRGTLALAAVVFAVAAAVVMLSPLRVARADDGSVEQP